MSRAPRLTADAAPLAGDRHAERTQEQRLDCEEGEQLGPAQHLVARLGGGWLRLRLLRLLWLHVRGDWRIGRREQTERGAPRSRAALRHGPTRHGQQGKRGGDGGEQAAPETVSDWRLGALSCQAAISSPSTCPHKDRSSYSEFIFVNR
jgi:hypothetical protein